MHSAHRMRWRGPIVAVAATAVSVVALCSPVQATPPPPNPTDGQLQSADAARARAANDVGRLSGLIAGVEARMNRLDDQAELAKELYNKAMWQLQQATDAAGAARHNVQTAQSTVDIARTKFSLYIRSSFMNRGGSNTGLLTAGDANILLARRDLDSYTSTRQVGAIGDLNRAKTVKSNADAAARSAVNRQKQLTTAAADAERRAVVAAAAAADQRGVLVTQKAGYQQQLQAAGMRLTGLKDQRAAYQAWQVAEARRRAEAARRAAEERRRMLAAQQAERERIAAAQQRAREAQQRQQQQQQQQDQQRQDQQRQQQDQQQQDQQRQQQDAGGNANPAPVAPAPVAPAPVAPAPSDPAPSDPAPSGGNSGGGSTAPASGWSAGQGQAAADRAMRWLGTPYSFAAGNENGTSYGVCTSDAGFNDCHVKGFDCSGLVMYAWGPLGVHMPHYAAWQYDFGSVHPSVDQLMPGDLLFWSSNGTQAGIHHVAIYIGGGNVVHAPQSGDVVKVSPLWMDEYFGAVRPGS